MAERMNVAMKLVQIQRELKVPKSQFNSFAKYHFRSCEDITEAAKPVCAKFNCALTLSDDLVEISGRFYVKSTARLTDAETGESIFTTAFAREAETKKGSDESQLTGATMSYARKYALGGLFALDDTKDSDFTNTGDGEKKRSLNSQIASIGESSPYVCADCGKPFTAFTDSKGVSHTAQEAWEMVRARSADGVARCKECRERLMKSEG